MDKTNNKGFFQFFLQIINYYNFPDIPDVFLLQPVVVVVFRDYALLGGVVDRVWSAELASSPVVVVDVAAVVGGAGGGGRGVGWGLGRKISYFLKKIFS